MRNLNMFFDGSLNFQESINHLDNSDILLVFCSNNRYPEKPGFNYEVKTIKKLCKLLSKFGKKFSEFEIKLKKDDVK